MSSAAHWLVLGAAASREKGGFICMGNGAVNTHASCGHAARSGCTFKGLKSSPPPQFSRAGALLLSISWPLSPPPPLSRFHASSFLLLSQCHPSYVGGGAAAILDSLKMETGKKKNSPRLLQLRVICWVCSNERFFIFFLRGLNAVREQNKAWKSAQLHPAVGNRPGPVCSLSGDQGTAPTQVDITYCVWEPTL